MKRAGPDSVKGIRHWSVTRPGAFGAEFPRHHEGALRVALDHHVGGQLECLALT